MPNFTQLAKELASREDWTIYVVIAGNQFLRCPVCGALLVVQDKMQHARWHVEQESR